MSNIKHVGRVIATGKKCIVAYRTLPGDSGYCLVVPTENLPDSYHDALINLVESSSGQEAYEFAEAMARSTFPDGSTMLPCLHSKGRLVKIATDAVEMLPNNGVAIQLSELNQIIAEQRGVAVDELSIKPETQQDRNTQVKEIVKVKDLSPVAKSEDFAEPDVESMSIDEKAKYYRREADRLSKESARLKRIAEDLVPTGITNSIKKRQENAKKYNVELPASDSKSNSKPQPRINSILRTSSTNADADINSSINIVNN